ncbi:MAG: glycoside hydrolase family 95 protein, partial [Hungatella sp.]|nr:glycoside hydrolase family 95 protein [Hungatella sp.]
MKKTLQKNLWFKRPGESWIEGLPIGNGRIGAMTEGGINLDHMYLNEESVWAGRPEDCVRGDGAVGMKKLRECLFAGDVEQTEEIVMNQIMPEKRWFGSYQVLGELGIRSLKTVEYKDYERNLDLDTGTVQVRYTGTGDRGTKAWWEKEYFASAPCQVIAIRYTCSERETMALEISLSREEGAVVSSPKEDSLLLSGQCSDGILRFAGMVKAVPDGGTMKVFRTRPKAPPVLRIHGAKAVELYVAARTSYNCAAYEKQCAKDVEEAAALGYEEVRLGHIREYGEYYHRFDIGFEQEGQEELKELTTYERLKKLKSGGRDENFYALLTNYHRYLLLSSSRPGCLPSNLQGLWNYQIFAPWESDYHTNINLQINYWPAEGYHLSECHTPLFDWLKRVKGSGEKTAKDYYGAGGWTLHHASNLFAHTAPCAVPAGLWPMGGAWLVRHLYEHYLYTGDEKFLREEAYPLMKGAAEFILDFLTAAPAPQLIAACHVLRRLLMPRHSPCALFSLTCSSQS